MARKTGRKPNLPIPPADLQPDSDAPPPEVAAILAKLPPKRAAFVLYYHLTNNATEAAKRAGYSARSAHTTGYRLLKDDDVSTSIEKLQGQRAARAIIDRDWIEGKLVTVVERSLQEVAVVDKDGSPTGIFEFDARGANGALKLIGDLHGLYLKVVENKGTPVDDMIRRLAEARRDDTGSA